MKMIITIFATTLISTSFAGVLKNKDSGETLDFLLNRATRQVEIFSTANKVPNKTINLSSLYRGRASYKNWSILLKAINTTNFKEISNKKFRIIENILR